MHQRKQAMQFTHAELPSPAGKHMYFYSGGTRMDDSYAATTTWEGVSTNRAWCGFFLPPSALRDWRATVPRAAGGGRESSEIRERRPAASRPVDSPDLTGRPVPHGIGWWVIRLFKQRTKQTRITGGEEHGYAKPRRRGPSEPRRRGGRGGVG